MKFWYNVKCSDVVEPREMMNRNASSRANARRRKFAPVTRAVNGNDMLVVYRLGPEGGGGGGWGFETVVGFGLPAGGGGRGEGIVRPMAGATRPRGVQPLKRENGRYGCIKGSQWTHIDSRSAAKSSPSAFGSEAGETVFLRYRRRG